MQPSELRSHEMGIRCPWPSNVLFCICSALVKACFRCYHSLDRRPYKACVCVPLQLEQAGTGQRHARICWFHGSYRRPVSKARHSKREVYTRHMPKRLQSTGTVRRRRMRLRNFVCELHDKAMLLCCTDRSIITVQSSATEQSNVTERLKPYLHAS